MRRALGFVPIDEPLLSLIFINRLCTVSKLFGTSVLLPKPQVLLGVKLNSVINRDKEHKRIKDITDIYALLWFSDVEIAQIRAQLLTTYPEEKARRTVQAFTGDEISKVSKTIGVSESEIKRVLA